MGQTYTPAQCDQLLLADLRKHQVVILAGNKANCIGNAPLTPNQRDALTDFIFNVGTTKFCKSGLAAKLKARDYPGAAREFPKWKYAGGRVLPGLVKRRKAEQDLFLSNQRSEPNDTLSGRATALLMRLS